MTLESAAIFRWFVTQIHPRRTGAKVDHAAITGDRSDAFEVQYFAVQVHPLSSDGDASSGVFDEGFDLKGVTALGLWMQSQACGMQPNPRHDHHDLARGVQIIVLIVVTQRVTDQDFVAHAHNESARSDFNSVDAHF